MLINTRDLLAESLDQRRPLDDPRATNQKIRVNYLSYYLYGCGVSPETRGSLCGVSPEVGHFVVWCFTVENPTESHKPVEIGDLRLMAIQE